MRRWILPGLLMVVCLAGAGFWLSRPTGLPAGPVESLRAVEDLTDQDLRQIEAEWDKFWFTDQPSHLTPIRIHGGVGP